MGQGQNPRKGTGWLNLGYEVVRGAAAAILLIVLWQIGLPIALVLLLPVLVYLGLWLLTGSSSPARSSPSMDSVRRAYADCRGRQDHIEALIIQVPDPATFALAQRIAVRIEQIMVAIADDAHYEVAPPLLALLSATEGYLAHYVKLIARGHDPSDMNERVSDDLKPLVTGLDSIWSGLRQQGEQDLGELGRELEKTAREVPQPAAAQALPPVLPEPGEKSYPPDIARKINSLTRRELEILRMLPSGMTDEEIGKVLFIAKRTVTTHLTVIYSKIEVRNRTGAVAFVMGFGLV